MWYLEKIPKTAHFYWGNNTISFLRYLTVISFRKFNPDWQIKLYYPQVRYQGENTWNTPEHINKFTGENYFDKLFALDIEKIEIDFSQFGIDINIPESFKADFLRWQLLAAEGGLWSDFDIIYFKSMDNLYFNNEANKEIDTFVCINPYRVYYRHLIGFLLSSPNNDFYKYIYNQSYLRLNLKSYQSIGSLILNDRFQTIQSIKNMFSHMNIANINTDAVYPLNELNITSIYNSNDLSCLTDYTTGIHWYAGHPDAGQWENSITENNFKSFDTGLSKIIGKVI